MLFDYYDNLFITYGTDFKRTSTTIWEILCSKNLSETLFPKRLAVNDLEAWMF